MKKEAPLGLKTSEYTHRHMRTYYVHAYTHAQTIRREHIHTTLILEELVVRSFCI